MPSHRTDRSPQRQHAPTAVNAPALSATEFEELQDALDSLPESAEALDVSALDGYLCGVLLQPHAVPEPRWWPHVLDVDGRAVAMPPARQERVRALVRRRHAELTQAISRRQWFDPWVFELDDDGAPATQAVLPWVAGFATAMELFPALMALDGPALLEPLAVLYAGLDPDDLEDADALLAVIETLEPPSTLEEAVEDLVTSTLRLADVSRPLAAPTRGRAPGLRSRR